MRFKGSSRADAADAKIVVAVSSLLNLTDSEKEKVQEIRHTLDKNIPSSWMDHDLVRFLRTAKKQNVNAAITLIEKHLAWKEDTAAKLREVDLCEQELGVDEDTNTTSSRTASTGAAATRTSVLGAVLPDVVDSPVDAAIARVLALRHERLQQVVASSGGRAGADASSSGTTNTIAGTENGTSTTAIIEEKHPNQRQSSIENSGNSRSSTSITTDNIFTKPLSNDLQKDISKQENNNNNKPATSSTTPSRVAQPSTFINKALVKLRKEAAKHVPSKTSSKGGLNKRNKSAGATLGGGESSDRAGDDEADLEGTRTSKSTSGGRARTFLSQGANFRGPRSQRSYMSDDEIAAYSTTNRINQNKDMAMATGTSTIDVTTSSTTTTASTRKNLRGFGSQNFSFTKSLKATREKFREGLAARRRAGGGRRSTSSPGPAEATGRGSRSSQPRSFQTLVPSHLPSGAGAVLEDSLSLHTSSSRPSSSTLKAARKRMGEISMRRLRLPRRGRAGTASGEVVTTTTTVSTTTSAEQGGEGNNRTIGDSRSSKLRDRASRVKALARATTGALARRVPLHRLRRRGRTNKAQTGSSSSASGTDNENEQPSQSGVEQRATAPPFAGVMLSSGALFSTSKSPTSTANGQLLDMSSKDRSFSKETLYTAYSRPADIGKDDDNENGGRDNAQSSSSWEDREQVMELEVADEDDKDTSTTNGGPVAKTVKHQDQKVSTSRNNGPGTTVSSAATTSAGESQMITSTPATSSSSSSKEINSTMLQEGQQDQPQPQLVSNVMKKLQVQDQQHLDQGDLLVAGAGLKNHEQLLGTLLLANSKLGKSSIQKVQITYLEQVEHEIRKWYPQGWAGRDRSGRPVYIERIGSVNVAELTKVFDPITYELILIRQQEHTRTLKYLAASWKNVRETRQRIFGENYYAVGAAGGALGGPSSSSNMIPKMQASSNNNNIISSAEHLPLSPAGNSFKSPMQDSRSLLQQSNEEEVDDDNQQLQEPEENLNDKGPRMEQEEEARNQGLSAVLEPTAAPQRSTREPHLVHDSIIVMDLRGGDIRVCYSKVVSDMFTLFSKVNIANYPEATSQILAIGAPPGFKYMWALARNLCDSSFGSKMEVLKSPSDLFRYIEPSQLPSFVGGTFSDDASCDDYHPHHPWNDLEFLHEVKTKGPRKVWMDLQKEAKELWRRIEEDEHRVVGLSTTAP
ncbi:unnamed protein product [Amoebophrya sp. A25]|nr:unnamed protein product [Amoebophrya sp. A25]|eukprot:GSA25T00012662001.1